MVIVVSILDKSLNKAHAMPRLCYQAQAPRKHPWLQIWIVKYWRLRFVKNGFKNPCRWGRCGGWSVDL